MSMRSTIGLFDQSVTSVKIKRLEVDLYSLNLTTLSKNLCVQVLAKFTFGKV